MTVDPKHDLMIANRGDILTHLNLKGWNQIIYSLIRSKFKEKFTLKEIYAYVPEFKKVYPANFHIEAKIRQILQQLRDKKLLRFTDKGVYYILYGEHEEQMIGIQIEGKTSKLTIDHKADIEEMVYLLSNVSIPGWVKIGRTSNVDKRLKDLYNTSVPLPFKLEESIRTYSHQGSITLEKSIHTITDTLNLDLRKNTEAKNREFFKLSVMEAKQVFSLVKTINSVELTNEGAYA